MKTKEAKKAFTLTELVVCIGIIALLAAILFPVFVQVRRQSQKATCQSNLRQIGFALRQYVNENDETWPTYTLWGVKGFTTTKLAGCPQTMELPHETNPANIRGYAYSGALTTEQSGPEGYNVSVGYRDKDIVYPATTVIVCDAALGHSVIAGPNPYHFNPRKETPDGEEKGWLRHKGGANYLFADGHVKWYPPDAVGYNIFGTNKGNAPTFAL